MYSIPILTLKLGTAILVHKKIQFNATTVISDPQGQFVIVPGLLYCKPFGSGKYLYPDLG